MFFPYKDINPTHRFAVVTFLMIWVNIIIFFYQIFGIPGFDETVRQFALIPVELYRGNLPESALVSPQLTALTYMFLHGSLGHMVFNMLFLWIFGNNIEDRMTRTGFLFFYLLAGIVSGVIYAAINPGSAIPLVGASGAISAVMGAYLFLFPFARIHVLFIIIPIRMPAMIFIAFWFVSQVSGLMNGRGEIAWISHITGFVWGIVMHRFFLRHEYGAR
jgi:membrane associated rhomboid family serine protease